LRGVKRVLFLEKKGAFVQVESFNF
jgi:hypothetical protein